MHLIKYLMPAVKIISLLINHLNIAARIPFCWLKNTSNVSLLVAASNPMTYDLPGFGSGPTGIASTMTAFPWKLIGDLKMTSLAPENYVK